MPYTLLKTVGEFDSQRSTRSLSYNGFISLFQTGDASIPVETFHQSLAQKQLLSAKSPRTTLQAKNRPVWSSSKASGDPPARFGNKL